MTIFHLLLDPAVVWVTIPVSAIFVFGALAIVKNIIRHRERMAKIGMGFDPDDRTASPGMHSQYPDRSTSSR